MERLEHDLTIDIDERRACACGLEEGLCGASHSSMSSMSAWHGLSSSFNDVTAETAAIRLVVMIQSSDRVSFEEAGGSFMGVTGMFWRHDSIKA